MKLYKICTYILFLWIVVYSQFISPKNHWSEDYPFFHWSLYSSAAKHHWQFDIIIEDCNQSWRTCPLTAEATKNRDYNEDIYWLIQFFGNAYRNNSSDFKTLQSQLEKRIFVGGKPTNYKLDLIIVDPVKFINSNEIVSQETLANFEVENHD